ncbi:MAG TPA: GNAT family N-acetyltransferase, partial [Kouleothrix sp.]|nr:GNAT family N-acetyltransferase [Kouleothrix sp.]
VQVGVVPEWRGRGLGAALVAEVLRRAQAGGAQAIMLDVNVNNPGAARVYARLGFAATGQRARYLRAL